MYVEDLYPATMFFRSYIKNHSIVRNLQSSINNTEITRVGELSQDVYELRTVGGTTNNNNETSNVIYLDSLSVQLILFKQSSSYKHRAQY